MGLAALHFSSSHTEGLFLVAWRVVMPQWWLMLPKGAWVSPLPFSKYRRVRIQGWCLAGHTTATMHLQSSSVTGDGIAFMALTNAVSSTDSIMCLLFFSLRIGAYGGTWNGAVMCLPGPLYREGQADSGPDVVLGLHRVVFAETDSMTGTLDPSWSSPCLMTTYSMAIPAQWASTQKGHSSSRFSSVDSEPRSFIGTPPRLHCWQC